MKKYNRINHSVFNICYHLIFSSKYRKPYFHLFDKFIKRCFYISSVKLKFIIENIEIMPDHVHLFIRCKNTTSSVSDIVKHLKGFSSYTIRKKYISLKKYKSFWTSSYFSESIGNISEKTIKKYIDNQKINLKPTYKFKKLVNELNACDSNYYIKKNNYIT